uniref:Protein-methionine sulfoxide oxidase mical3a n=1 Tax=Aceria tosichella TaxID=561515 RepID=A0A6G1SNX6_9ACAR
MDVVNLDELSISGLFERFIEATTMRNVLSIHKKILDSADLKPCEFNTFFPKYKRAITANRQKRNWKAKALFSKIEKRANHKCYSNTKAPTSVARACDIIQADNVIDDSISSQSSHRLYANNNALKNYKCLIIGSGPAGLRTAIELQLLGSDKVVIVEKRGRFSRNNVLHLWPFVIDDLKSLGAKKFYGKFCAGSIDHISIRQLQLILLKVCLMIGCDFRDSCSYISLCPSSIKQKVSDSTRVDDDSKDLSDQIECNYKKDEIGPQDNVDQCVDNTLDNSNESKCDSNQQSLSEPKPIRSSAGKQKLPGTLEGASAHFESDVENQEKELHSIEWDIIIGADGRRNTLKNFFPRKEFRGRLAIAITANFINRQTTAETSVPEISGLSFIYNQDMFNALAYDTNIELENICYYKDDTHYFVMTAKKKSLLERGVLINDYATTQDLLSDKNVNKEALLKYAKDAAYWTTGLEPLDFALNHYGQEDCAMFDFTSMYAASNACKALRTQQGGLTLVSLVGDSLLEPFWPTGSGCARGFLSSFDAAWMCRQWAVNKCAVLDHHNAAASRSSRNRNSNANEHHKSNHLEPTTYDKMALSVIAERESIYRILAQTTSENLQQNYSLWTLNPHTRYPNLNRHLILPSQVEHLIADESKLKENQSLSSSGGGVEDGRRVKSPTKSRRSPKKLKSAGASPLAQPRNARNKAKPLTKHGHKSKSRHDIAYDDYYLKLEESYRDLADDKGGLTQYLNYKRRDSTGLDDLYISSLSGTLPSSHNLSRLEARKARDIDECLRHRRQKTKITYVRDQLISQMRGEGQKDKSDAKLFAGGNAALFNEIKRMREQQSQGGRADSKPRETVTGPLSLLNSMRRCASFAERVKSFESKLAQPNPDSSESNVSTPKTPIDNVRNLPQFATLQELFVNSTPKSDERPKKSQIPVTKLTKDDWNVKCWESRLASCKQKQLSTSSKSLNKAVSVDSAHLSRVNKPQKQIDVFQDRINQMANKLETAASHDKQSGQSLTKYKAKPASTTNQEPPSIRAQGWVNHLKRELAKGSEFSKRSVNGQPMNPAIPSKPIKKLFEDDDDDDDGIDVNKHYDHLCINRPTNKYLTKGAYTSHLARTNVTSKIINRPKPTSESKQAYLAALTSRGSSASSTLSDYSTNTGHSSSGSGGKQQQQQQVHGAKTSTIDVECFRCRKFVSSTDRITIGSSLLHRSCLTCANCGITLRSNEIQHYMDVVRNIRARNDQISVDDEVKFSCVICNPLIRAVLTREADNRLAEAVAQDQEQQQQHLEEYQDDLKISLQQQRFQSREAFLTSSINYTELYKNILNNDQGKLKESTEKDTDDKGKENWQASRCDVGREEKSSPDKNHESNALQLRPTKVTPSPIQVTIPMKLVTSRTSDDKLETDDDDDDERATGFSSGHGKGERKLNSAASDAINCSEEVTLILPSESRRITPSPVEPDDKSRNNGKAPSESRRASAQLEMIDEEELQRILHLDKHQTSRNSSSSNSGDGTGSTTNSSKTDDDAPSEDDDDTANSCSSNENRNDDPSAAKGASSSYHQKHSQSVRAAASADQAATTDDESSSLDLPSDTDEYDDDDEDDDDENEDNLDMNSTCDDFITTEEFDGDGDKEEENDTTLSEASGRHSSTSGSREPTARRGASEAGLQATT